MESDPISAIQYSDRHSMRIQREYVHMILVLIHILVNHISNAGVVCYTGRHSSIIAASGLRRLARTRIATAVPKCLFRFS